MTTPTHDDPAHAAPPARTYAPQPTARERLEGHFRVAVFVVLLAIGAIATLRAYLALEQSILVWLRPQFVPLVQAVFSLAIVGVCVWLIRSWVIARGE